MTQFENTHGLTVRAPTLPGSVYVSAAGLFLYEKQPPIEENATMQRSILDGSVQRASQISPIATLFPSEVVRKNDPPDIYGGDQMWRALNERVYAQSPSEVIPGCALSLLRKATVQNAAIYLDNGDVCTMLYELHRPNDRVSTTLDEQIHARERRRLPDDGTAYIFIASAGSHNWGHWLTDDLPRVAGAALLRNHMPDRRVAILLLSFDPGIDEARRQSVTSHPDLAGVDVVFIERFIAYQFDELYYATPVSYHPTLKLHGAVDYVRRSYMQGAGSRKLYVARPAHNIRALANTEEVEAHMRQAGFEIVECLGLSFEEQRRLFSEADTVVGVMGAAMTNTIFTPAGARVVHLACEGWVEPYYWDLANACGHSCTYVFGPTADPTNVPHFSRFNMPIALIDTALA